MEKYPCLKDAKTSKYWVSINDCVCMIVSNKKLYFYNIQHTFNKQLSQRYRNNRRRSSQAKSVKVVLPEANITATKENTTPADLQDEEDDENTQALQKLVKGKNPPAQTIQNLLIATRASREKWLLSPSISIHDILEKYTVLRNFKWVSIS